MLRWLKDKSTYETIVRYVLGLSMLPYGLSKILRTQFIVLPFHTWLEPLKDIPGTTLTWAFLGYSPWFTVLLGLLEAIPAALLLFRKTKLLGALLLFPVLLNVFLINIALDLWPSTQKISLVMLLMNFALLLFHYSLLQEVFQRIFHHAGALERVGVETWVSTILLGTVTTLVVYEITDYTHQRNFLTGDWYNKRPTYWVEQDSLYKRERPSERNDENFVRYFFQPYQGAFRLMPGNKHPIYCQYELDETNQLLTVRHGNDSSVVVKGKYKILHDDLVEWTVNEEGKKRWLSRQHF